MGGRRSSQFLAAGALLPAALSAVTAAQAQAAPDAPPEPSRIIWSAAPDCGSKDSFLSELRSRTARLRPAAEGEHATTLIVEMMRDEGGVHGQLTVRKANGDLLTREVPGRNCQEVASAMALIAALMVDPLAARSEDDSTPVVPSRRPARRPHAAESDWTLRGDLRLTGRTAVAPEVAWGESIGAMLTWEKNRFRPSVQLSFLRAQGSASRSFGSAELRWTAGQLVLCPWGAQPGTSWDVRACALFQLGRLRGSGYDTPNPTEGTIVWSAAGIQLEGRLKLVGPLWAGVDAALLQPFTQERFYVEPSRTLFRVPAWGTSFGAGLGLLFF